MENLFNSYELIPIDSHCFIPCDCVELPESTSTKLRVLFDATCKTTSQVSLNDFLFILVFQLNFIPFRAPHMVSCGNRKCTSQGRRDANHYRRDRVSPVGRTRNATTRVWASKTPMSVKTKTDLLKRSIHCHFTIFY